MRKEEKQRIRSGNDAKNSKREMMTKIASQNFGIKNVFDKNSKGGSFSVVT
jgi:hypothetical protein